MIFTVNLLLHSDTNADCRHIYSFDWRKHKRPEIQHNYIMSLFQQLKRISRYSNWVLCSICHGSKVWLHKRCGRIVNKSQYNTQHIMSHDINHGWVDSDNQRVYTTYIWYQGDKRRRTTIRLHIYRIQMSSKAQTLIKFMCRTIPISVVLHRIFWHSFKEFRSFIDKSEWIQQENGSFRRLVKWWLSANADILINSFLIFHFFLFNSKRTIFNEFR